MSSNLIDARSRFIRQRATYASKRGMATHIVAPAILHRRQDFMHLKPRAFEKLLPQLMASEDSKAIRKHYVKERRFHTFVAGVYKHLFNLLENHGVTDIWVEPHLGWLNLTPQFQLELGTPDILAYSRMASGLVGYEIKTGLRRSKVDFGKVHRYHYGMRQFCKQQGLSFQPRSLGWVSFFPKGEGDYHRSSGVKMAARFFEHNTADLAQYLTTQRAKAKAIQMAQATG